MAAISACVFLCADMSRVDLSLIPTTSVGTVDVIVTEDIDGPRGEVDEQPYVPRSFVINEHRLVAGFVGHLLLFAVAFTAVFLGQLRSVSSDRPVLPVRKWRGRTLGVPLHRGPPVNGTSIL